jgi:hypothetical protein
MQHTLASFHRKTNHGPRPSPSSKLATTPIKVNPVAFTSVVNNVPTADYLQPIYKGGYRRLVEEWFTHLAKTTK